MYIGEAPEHRYQEAGDSHRHPNHEGRHGTGSIRGEGLSNAHVHGVRGSHEETTGDQRPELPRPPIQIAPNRTGVAAARLKPITRLALKVSTR